ncbi:MAG: ion channel [Chloroflexota bacterium]
MARTVKPKRSSKNENPLPEFEVSGLYGLPILNDAYYAILSASWSAMILYAFVAYVVTNLLFGTLFWLGGPESIGNSDGSWLNAFYFSVQTFSTIGYGSMSPTTTWAHVLVTLESFIGLVAVAVGTGLIFAKFSRPSARINFSKKMVVHNRNGIRNLNFRMASERSDSRIINAKIRVSVLITLETDEGHMIRRFFPLKLTRDEMPMFALMLNVYHPVDEDSPFFNMDADTYREKVGFFVVSFEGLDDTFLTTVMANHIYRPEDIEFGAEFVDMIEFAGDDPNGKRIVRHENLSKTFSVSMDLANEAEDEPIDDLETS